MTVNELIQQLQTYPGDMRVLTLGYAGYDDNDDPLTGTKCVIITRGA